MAEQLDRVYNLVGQRRIELGILPFGAQLRRTAPHAFWIYDRRLVIVETISEELWLTGEEGHRTVRTGVGLAVRDRGVRSAGPPDWPCTGLSRTRVSNPPQAICLQEQSRAIAAQSRNRLHSVLVMAPPNFAQRYEAGDTWLFKTKPAPDANEWHQRLYDRVVCSKSSTQRVGDVRCRCLWSSWSGDRSRRLERCVRAC